MHIKESRFSMSYGPGKKLNKNYHMKEINNARFLN